MVVNATEKKLNELLELKNKKIITDEEYNSARLSTLGVSPDKPSTPSGMTIENEHSKQRRELLHLVSKWIGTSELPKLGDDLWEQTFNVTPDEGLRIQIAKITGKSRRRRELTSIFKMAGKSVTPPALVGSTDTHAIARRLARDFLLELAAALLTSQCQKTMTSTERSNLWSETLSLIQDEDTAKNATTILQNLKQTRTIQNCLDNKRPREENDRHEERKANFPPGERLTKEKMIENKKKGLCHKCGGHGHIAVNCPSKK